jgi:hypothetical protein
MSRYRVRVDRFVTFTRYYDVEAGNWGDAEDAARVLDQQSGLDSGGLSDCQRKAYVVSAGTATKGGA